MALTTAQLAAILQQSSAAAVNISAAISSANGGTLNPNTNYVYTPGTYTPVTTTSLTTNEVIAIVALIAVGFGLVFLLTRK